jgi:hypothetical protein
MARIPVEKKGGTPWLWWVLGLILLVGAIWLLAELFDTGEVDMAAVEPTAPAAVEPDVTAPITTLETILAAENTDQLVGREVQLSGVTASQVTGDSTYWVHGPDAEARVFVVLTGLGESEPGPGTGEDGRFNVDEGETMTVEGVIQPVEPSAPEAWGVTDTEAQEIAANRVYVRARTLENLTL